MIVFLTCRNNNRAETVFDSFHGAVQQFGLPSRVRSDKGMENVDVTMYMLATCNGDLNVAVISQDPVSIIS